MFKRLAVGLCISLSLLAYEDKVPQIIEEAKALAGSPILISAVTKSNDLTAREVASFTNEDWAKLAVRDPKVQSYIQNPTTKWLRMNLKPYVSEAFVSDSTGNKVCFLSKTSKFNHQGSAKHDEPMKGNTWRGPVELDESSGTQQFQVSVPILSQSKPVGSLVLGIAVAKLGK